MDGAVTGTEWGGHGEDGGGRQTLPGESVVCEM